jgi:maltooligosyltrehalose trehalohydrolase
MARFDVWAPGRRRVELLLCPSERVPMAPGKRGWWHVEVPRAKAGDRYFYSLEGGPGRPDPRSAWQPDGVDGPSALVDHGTFSWSDEDWAGFDLPPAVLYEMHVGTFSEQGTFDAAIEHLGHLLDLGVTAVEVMPVAEFSGSRGWGYDGADLWAPNAAYGGPEGFKRFVDACHQNGLGVVLDVVYNHLGPAGNYLSEFGPYFTDRYQTPWGWAVNFDGEGSYGTRDFVVSNARMWYSDYHVDGLRLDAVHAIFDESALHILEELSVAVGRLADDLRRDLWLIAESDRNDPRICRPRDKYGYGIDACWDDDFHHALHTVLTGENVGYYVDFGQISQLAKAFHDGYVFDGQFSEFRQRRHGRPAGDLAGESFVCCLQNHDQVGNRAFGERLSALAGPGLLKVGAALVLLSPFVPMLFQGEEWAASTPFLYFTDPDPELGRAVREGRRREFPIHEGAEVPDPQGPATFARSKLDWSELAREPHRDLLDWYRQLLALRRKEPDLGAGDRKQVVTAFSEDARWLVVRRGRFSIAANFAAFSQAAPLELGGSVVLASSAGVVVDGPGNGGGTGTAANSRANVRLPAHSVAVVAH